MKFESKLFPGSIVALVLGIILATPLLYTSTAIAPDTATSDSLFDVELAYAYINYQNRSVTVPPSSTDNTTTGTPAIEHSIQSTIGLNFTKVSDQVDICDVRTEIYLIEVYSDKGHIENKIKCEGIIYNESIVGEPIDLLPDVDSNPFFDRPVSGGGGATTLWPVGESRVTFSGGGRARTNDVSWTDNLRYAEAVFIRVTRLGWSLLTGNSTEYIVLSTPVVVAEVELTPFGDGFIYNNLITAEELSQLESPHHPYGNILDEPYLP